MKITIAKHNIEFYDSAETLNILRYQKFNKYLMLDNQVGSTIQDYDKRLMKSIQFLSQDMKEETRRELDNARQAIYNIQNEFSPKQKAIAVLVKKIDDKYYKNIDAGTISEIEKHLDRIGFTKELMDEVLEKVKKK
jgi:gas vesicle protein